MNIIIVQHTTTKENFILISSKRDDRFSSAVDIIICDKDGKLKNDNSRLYKIIEINGKPISELLKL